MTEQANDAAHHEALDHASNETSLARRPGQPGPPQWRLIVLAKSALNDGAKDVAAALACAALGDALKRFALMNGLAEVQSKSMQDVGGALKSKGLVGGAQKTLLDAMPKIRDYAMHANWEKITRQDVGSVVGFVEQILITKFS